MPTLNKDPRKYVKSVPLPASSQHAGVKIQARCDAVYNPTVPSRKQVREQNYRRRTQQMAHQGFKSVPYQPYKGLGDPFYLDQKKLILHALGQWKEGQELDTSSSSDSSDEDDEPQHLKHQKQRTAASFLRQPKKGLNTLSKEVANGRDLMKNVRLGHGLFHLLRSQSEAKTEATRAELQRRRQQMWNDWQEAHIDSDSNSDSQTDDDLTQDMELNQYMSIPVARGHQGGSTSTPAATECVPPLDARDVAFKEHSSGRQDKPNDNASEYDRPGRSAAQYGSSRTANHKKLVPSRPYTPVHSTICSEQNQTTLKFSLFRQLCALFWILEAMNIEPPQTMGPISMCWNLKEVGGTHRSSVAKQNKEKVDLRWKQFVTNQQLRPSDQPGYLSVGPRRSKIRIKAPAAAPSSGEGHISGSIGNKKAHQTKRFSGPRASLKNGRRSSALHAARGSVSSVAASLAGSQTGLQGGSQTAGVSSRMGGQAIPEGRVSRVGSEQEDEESANNKSQEESQMFGKDGGDPGAAEHGATAAQRRRSSALSTASDRSPTQHRKHDPSPPDTSGDRDPKIARTRKRTGTSPQRDGPTVISRELHLQIIQSINRSEEDPRFDKLANPQEKRSSSTLRAEANIRPKSTPAVMEYEASLPSTKVGSMPMEMRQHFSEICEDKALVLHDTLEALERERMRKLREMFSSMPPRGTSLYRALEQIRSKSAMEEEESKETRRRSSTHQQWYLDLCSCIPDDLSSEWYLTKILDKLSKYGLVEASKQSTYKFLKVLSGLRDWEVCSPDISAAIEFCREKIVELSVEDYEDWFKQQFPKVQRPHTAPPTVKKENKPAGNDAKKSKSAPAGGRRPKTSLAV